MILSTNLTNMNIYIFTFRIKFERNVLFKKDGQNKFCSFMLISVKMALPIFFTKRCVIVFFFLGNYQKRVEKS